MSSKSICIHSASPDYGSQSIQETPKTLNVRNKFLTDTGIVI